MGARGAYKRIYTYFLIVFSVRRCQELHRFALEQDLSGGGDGEQICANGRGGKGSGITYHGARLGGIPEQDAVRKSSARLKISLTDLI